MRVAGFAWACAWAVGLAAQPGSLVAVEYRLSFPEPEHRWMQVDATFSALPPAPLQIRMSRTSPGRYALHEFSKNVFEFGAFDGSGTPLEIVRPDLHQWDVSGHDGTVLVVYKIFGDRIDGTYLSVDATHAHINIPAALVWARGLEGRPAQVTFVRPDGSTWNVATQLFPTEDALTFTAPNVQYLLDSPAEFGDFLSRTFTVDDPTPGRVASTFRIALHHAGTEAEADRFAADVERIARESRAIYGRFPRFDGGVYTFLSDYLPHASGDGMEHRNSTVLTSSGSLQSSRVGLLNTVAHELFHAWNVERIRPRSLEPFDFEAANVSDLLWLAEGFTSYYSTLIMHRTGLQDLDATLRRFGQYIDTAATSPGRQYRSAVEMSRLAPFVDAARAVDPTTWDNTFISYYTWGAAIGLGLDLSLRDRTAGRVGLDDYMRTMWQAYGAPSGDVPGVVATPYTLVDAEAILVEVSGDEAFAADFFSRFVAGREVVDYARLLPRVGLTLRRRAPGQTWLGDVQFEYGTNGAQLQSAAPFGSPLYDAGIDRGDVLQSINGDPITSSERLDRALADHAPGDAARVVFLRRGASDALSATLVLAEDPHVEIAVASAADDAARAFRASWLESRIRN